MASNLDHDGRWKIVLGDCFERLAELPDGSVDAVVTDPPYGIDFKSERWDGRAIRHVARQRSGERMRAGDAFQLWCREWAAECDRLLKPGSHLAAFGSPRTAHRLAAGIEDARLELRDTLLWLYGSGMVKSRAYPGGQRTQLKPAYEPIVLARKPLDGATTRNIARHGTGALNAESCKVDGRLPANVMLSHSSRCRPGRCRSDCAIRIVDESADGARTKSTSRRQVSRLFYCPKATRREREAGCDQLERRAFDVFPSARDATSAAPEAANTHPTVKPLALMRWVVRLVSPDGGLVLDPFCGSGSTGAAAVLEGRRFIGIERERSFAPIARARIAHWASRGPAEGG